MRWKVLLTAVAAVLAGAGVATAAIPGDNGVINACYKGVRPGTRR